MDDQIKSVDEKKISAFKTQSGFSSNGQLNKTYDDCDSQKIIMSLLLKITPIVIYLLLKLLTNLYLGLFIIIVLLLAVDFWIFKNILAPKLAGIKWFIRQTQQNESKWCFLGCSQTRVTAKINVIPFWFSQIISIIFWIAIFLINLITLSVFWSGLAIFSCSLLILNFISFIQCKGQHQKTVNKLTKKIGYQMYQDDYSIKDSAN